MPITLFPKKITTQTMGLRTKEMEEIAVNADGKSVGVLRVWGVLSGKDPGIGTFGPFIKFRGNIAALNLLSGEEARSQVVIFPQVAETVVNTLFEKAASESAAVEFALEVTVELNPSQKGGYKFRYAVKPLIEIKGEDALSKMAKMLPAPSMYLNSKKSGLRK